MFAIGRHVSNLAGFACALPTPFDEKGRIDSPAFERLCDRQMTNGINALVVGETVGEAPTLTPEEHSELIRLAVRIARGRAPIIAGAGSNSTEHAIELTRRAERDGADAVLSVTPYYNKPIQDGLLCHFRAIAGSAGIPLIVHDVPSRTGCSLADDTLLRLIELPQIVGLVDATGDMSRPIRLRSLLGRDLSLLSGDDATALSFLAQGGDGCISVTANIAPELCREIFLALRRGQICQAQRIAGTVMDITRVLLRESNPAPVKYALSRLKLMSAKMRLPLVEPSAEVQAEIDAVLRRLLEANRKLKLGDFRRL